MENHIDNIEEYLRFIDSRGPDEDDAREEVDGISIAVDSLVWNPNKGKSTKMFMQILHEYPLGDVHSALDLGTGSGILALLLWEKGVRNILAVDNMEESIMCARKNIELAGAENDIEIQLSDLFSNIKGSFDLILFNAPATHPLRKDISRMLMGLWSPEENIRVRFLDSVNNHLNKGGRALLMYSRFVDYDPIPEEVLEKYPFSYSYLITNIGDMSESGILEIRKE